MNRLWCGVWLGLGLGAASLAASAGTAEAMSYCRDPGIDQQVAQAASGGLNLDSLATLSQRFEVASTDPDPGCGKTVAYCVGQSLALAYLDRAYDAMSADPPDLAQAKSLLVEGRRHGSPWQLLVALGDVDAALARATDDQDVRGQLYLDAAQTLQFALNAINDQPLCSAFGEVRPAPEDIARIRKRAQEAVMLSPHFELARTKSGDCGGIFLAKVRGIDVEAVPVPITFPTDKAEFTPEGQKAADALLQCLREKKLDAITLTGHTDQHGSDQYNLDLSARRLATVANFLKAGGYTGHMRLIPLGKREPFQPDDPTQHSAPEIDQMNRRVELRETAR